MCHVHSFIRFETQEGADEAVSQLSGKLFTNKKGISGTLTVVYALERDAVSTIIPR